MSLSALVVLLAAAAATPAKPAATAKPTPSLGADEIAKRSHLAVYYIGKDQVGDGTMTILDKDGSKRVREMGGMRLDVTDGGDQWYYVYFRKPADVAGLCYVVHKRPDSDDDRWIYLPSVDLVRPVVANDKTQSFVGSDFSYEDISGRHWNQDNHKLLGEDKVNGRPVWVLESVPKKPYPGYEKKITFVDKENFIALTMEFYQGGKKVRIGHANKIETIQGYPFVTDFDMENLETGRKTIMEMKNLKLDVGLTPELFGERYLKAPPRQWLK